MSAPGPSTVRPKATFSARHQPDAHEAEAGSREESEASNRHSGASGLGEERGRGASLSPADLELCRVDDVRDKNKATRRFYANQNRLIDSFIHHYNKYQIVTHADPDEEAGHVPSPPPSRHIALATNLSFATNVALLILKIIAAALSGSMTVVASAADSLLDIVSGLVLFVMQRAIKKHDPYKYPEGKSRMEPIGVVLFACVMGISSLQICIEAIKVMAKGFANEPPHLTISPFTAGILALTVLSKLLLYVYCRFVGERFDSSAALTYSQDHRNDVITNLLGVGAVFLAVQVKSLWMVDSIGALIIAGLIIYTWLLTGTEHAAYLAGTSAHPDLLKELTYIAYHHSEHIVEIDTVRAYHFGNNLLVELDVVLPEDMPLGQAHDIGESLQVKLEELDSVERAFVHLDYESTHKPEHKSAM